MIPPDPFEDLPAALAEDEEKLGTLLEGYRGRLRTMVELRLDTRLRGRVDPSDVLQEAFVEVTSRLPSFLADPAVPFYIWVRFITGQKILELHRRHLGRKKRDVRREVSLGRAFPEASTVALADSLLDHGPSPSHLAMGKERVALLRDALDSLKEIDREVIALRHFEGLENGEVAVVLGLSAPGASLRYVRAMRRLGAYLMAQRSEATPSPGAESRS